MNIDVYQMDKYIKEIVINEKIRNNSKILKWKLKGGAKPKITLESLKAVDALNESNKMFLNIIGEYFSSELVTRINALLPLVSIYFSRKQSGGGISIQDLILPVGSLIIGYSFKEKLGEENFNIFAVVCVCYCIYLILKKGVTGKNIEDILFNLFLSTENMEGGASSAKSGDQFGLSTMVVSGTKWFGSNIKSLISKAMQVMNDFISFPLKGLEMFNDFLIKFITGSKSSINAKQISSFKFNNSTGHIQFTGPSDYKIETKLSKKIYMYFNGDKTTYKVNNAEMNTISQIGGKPFATALVLSYVEHMESLGLGKPLISSSNDLSPSNKYKFELAPDSTVKIYEKDTNKLIESMSTSIQQWKSGDDVTAVKTAENVCKEMFGINPDPKKPNKKCSKYFYSILGR